MKKLAQITAALSLGLAAASLGLGQSGTTTVSFWHTYNSDSNENKTLVEKVIPAFEQANPGIKVDAQVVPYDEFRQKILTSIAGGQAPDLARLDIIWSPEFAQLGALEKLDGKPGFAALRDAVFKGPLSTNLWNGSYYGLPLDTNTQVIVYNQDALKAAGLTAFPRTVNEMQAYLAKLQKKQGDKVTQYGYALSGPWNWVVLPWIWSNGGDITDAKITKATGFLNGPRTVAAVQRLYDWYKAGLLAPTVAGSGVGTWEGLGNGQYAATQDGPWAFPALKSQYSKLNLAHAPFPRGAAGSVSIVGGENIVMFKESRNKDAAWKFLQYMLSPQAQITMASTGQIPVITAAMKDPYITNHPYYGLYLKQLQTAKARTPHPAYSKIEAIMQGATQEIFAGKKTVQAAYDEAATKIDELLK